MRGCSNSVYVPPAADVPMEGCTTLSGEEVCFCSQPFCNTMAMSPLPVPPPMPSNGDRMDDGSINKGNGSNRPKHRWPKRTPNPQTTSRSMNRVNRKRTGGSSSRMEGGAGRRSNTSKMGGIRNSVKREGGESSKNRQTPMPGNRIQNGGRANNQKKVNKSISNRGNGSTNRGMNDGRNPFESNRKSKSNDPKLANKVKKKFGGENIVVRVINGIFGTGRPNRNPYGRRSKSSKNL